MELWGLVTGSNDQRPCMLEACQVIALAPLGNAGVLARVLPQHHLPGPRVLAEDAAAVVDNEGRDRNALQFAHVRTSAKPAQSPNLQTRKHMRMCWPTQRGCTWTAGSSPRNTWLQRLPGNLHRHAVRACKHELACSGHTPWSSHVGGRRTPTQTATGSGTAGPWTESPASLQRRAGSLRTVSPAFRFFVPPLSRCCTAWMPVRPCWLECCLS